MAGPPASDAGPRGTRRLEAEHSRTKQARPLARSEPRASARRRSLSSASTGRTASMRQPTSPTEPRAHAPMSKIDGLAVHEGAPTHDGRNSVLDALLNRSLGHAPLTERAVEPYRTNLALRGLPDDVDRHIRMGRDHHTVEARRDAGKIRITDDTFDLRCVRVDGQDFVSAIPELAV